MVTSKTVIWVLLLLFAIIYLFAMVLRQGAGTYIESSSALPQDLELFWGSLPIAMLTLFKAIAGGLSWHECLQPFVALPWIWTVIFIVYICFTTLTVLNVITGVFCESAMEGASADRDMVVQKHMEQKRQYIDHVYRLFKEIDTDCSNSISFREFDKHFSSEESAAFFASLDIEAENSWEVFKLLDADEGGCIDLDEFVSGCVRLNGQAKTVDMVRLLQQSRRIDKMITELFQHQQELAALQREQTHSALLVQKMSSDPGPTRSETRRKKNKIFSPATTPRESSPVEGLADARQGHAAAQHQPLGPDVPNRIVPPINLASLPEYSDEPQPPGYDQSPRITATGVGPLLVVTC